MFGFLSMMGNYKDRAVARYERDNLFVDTCAVTDSREPYETAIAHPRYNEGKIVIVEMYGGLAEAKKGHKRWVKTMTAKKLPEALRDCSTAEVAKLCDAVSRENWRIKKAVKK